MDFFNYILKEFEVRGLFRERYKFIIVNRKIEELDKVNKESQISSIKILTPIERKDQIFTAEKEKLDKLNELYHITDKPIESIETPYDFHAVRFKINNPIYIGANKLIQEGYVGTIKFVEPITKTYLLRSYKLNRSWTTLFHRWWGYKSYLLEPNLIVFLKNTIRLLFLLQLILSLSFIIFF